MVRNHYAKNSFLRSPASYAQRRRGVAVVERVVSEAAGQRRVVVASEAR
jgi:hypothetical protein